MMTMTDVRADALGEFPPPPQCPSWCEIDHDKEDFRSLTSWGRRHQAARSTDLSEGYVNILVSAVDRCWGSRWEQRDAPELSVSGRSALFVRASRPDDVAALVALVSLISPSVAESIRAAALLVCSPEVTPAGEDQ